MSEQLRPHSVEGKLESLDLSEETRRNRERLEHAAKHETDHGDDVIDTLHTKAKEEAFSARETTIGERQEDSSQSPIGMQRELKNTAYLQTLQQVRAKLKTPEKVLSRLVHQPAVEKISEVGAKTVVRPSGILGGGIASLIGGGLLLYAAKHYGFEYNFSIFLLLLIGGFFIGVVMEMLIKLFKPTPK